MQLIPTYMSKDEFLVILDDIRTLVAAGDSFEGSLSYELPWHHTEMGDPAEDPFDGFRVRASYRTGNSMGQGGMRLVGQWDEPGVSDS